MCTHTSHVLLKTYEAILEIILFWFWSIIIYLTSQNINCPFLLHCLHFRVFLRTHLTVTYQYIEQNVIPYKKLNIYFLFGWLQKPPTLQLQDKNFMLLTSFNAICLDLKCIGKIITNLFLFFHPFSNLIYSNLTKEKMWVMNYYTKNVGCQAFCYYCHITDKPNPDLYYNLFLLIV